MLFPCIRPSGLRNGFYPFPTFRNDKMSHIGAHRVTIHIAVGKRPCLFRACRNHWICYSHASAHPACGTDTIPSLHSTTIKPVDIGAHRVTILIAAGKRPCLFRACEAIGYAIPMHPSSRPAERILSLPYIPKHKPVDVYRYHIKSTPKIESSLSHHVPKCIR